MGDRALSKVQVGLEATNGTAVAADTLIAGAEISAVNPDSKVGFPADSLGVRADSSRAIIYELLSENTLTVPVAYYQVLPVLFSCGLKGSITPTETTASQADWLWTFTPSMTGSNSIDSLTLERGDDTQAYEEQYFMIERYLISGSIAQDGGDSPVSIACDYFARQVTDVSFTGAISVPTMETINAKFSRIYIDSTWAGKGTTEVTSLLRSWELEILTGVHPKFLGSADKFFTVHGQNMYEVMLTLTWEGGTGADTEFNAYQAGTKKVIRVEIDSGTQIGTGTNHKVTFDVWGAYEHVTPLNEEDRGNNIHAALFHGLYDPTGSQMLDVFLTTDVAAI